MYYVMSNQEVLAAELEAKTQNGLNEDILIENAAAVICENVMLSVTKKTRILVLVGGGKNGADGLSAARKLFLSGYNVVVYELCDRLCGYASDRLLACEKLGVKVFKRIEPKDIELDNFDFIIDAMIGSGLKESVSGKIKDMIAKLSKTDIFTLSVDVPSGINSDTGMAMGEAVIATQTITFCAVRAGHLLNCGRDYCGKLIVANIGIKPCGDMFVATDEDVSLPKRKIFSHKYNYGRVCVIGGSPAFVGAPQLAYESATATLKSGAGLAVLCAPESLKQTYRAKALESTLLYMPDKDGFVTFDADCLNKIMQKSNAITIGMGMGDNPCLSAIINYLALNFAGTLVIDADGLNALSKDLSILDEHKANIILTPHLGEFARLCAGRISEDIGIIAQVKQLAKLLNAVVIAKSATSVISDGNQTVLNITGSPAMSKGGSGDVLSGVVAALSCRVSPIKASYIACYKFGLAGERAERKYGENGVIASNLIENLIF